MNETYNTPANPETPQGGKGFAIASMVLGITSVVCCCCYFLSLPCGILGLVFGIVNLAQKRPGRSMALAGVITSGVALVLTVIFILFSLYIFTENPQNGNVFWESFWENYNSFYGS